VSNRDGQQIYLQSITAFIWSALFSPPVERFTCVLLINYCIAHSRHKWSLYLFFIASWWGKCLSFVNHRVRVLSTDMSTLNEGTKFFDVFLTVHHSIDLFQLPN